MTPPCGERLARRWRAPHWSGAGGDVSYQLVRWLIPALERFPRRRRFLLGNRIRTTTLSALERLVEATFTRRRHADAGVVACARHARGRGEERRTRSGRTAMHGAASPRFGSLPTSRSRRGSSETCPLRGPAGHADPAPDRPGRRRLASPESVDARSDAAEHRDRATARSRAHRNITA